ncbi:CBS domain-containing protein [Fodinicola acaciae]|uniref:CBS domain-containing protein n=1 Tax=Fodinicola acaciae TaxID=2681555 RepID=UPI0013D31E92|nr:CBS domain-containing protein [Fodinicola acaciae]
MKTAIRPTPPDAVLGEPTAQDMMRTALFAVDERAKLLDVAAALRRTGAGVVLVLVDGVPVRVVNERTVRKELLRALSAGQDPVIGAVAAGRGPRVPAAAPVSMVAAALLHAPAGAVLVHDAGTVVGLITAGDLLRCLAGQRPAGTRTPWTGAATTIAVEPAPAADPRHRPCPPGFHADSAAPA